MPNSAHETEIKLAVPDARTARRFLRAAGFRVSRPRVFESNTIFDTPESGLRQAAEQEGLQIVDDGQTSVDWVIAGLDRAFRHHEGSPSRLGGQRHLGEEAGLQLAGILHPGHHLDLAGGRIGDVADVIDRGHEVPVTQRRDAEPHRLAPLRPQRLRLGHAEAQLQAAHVHERAEHVAGLDEPARLHRLGVDDARLGWPHLGASHVLGRDVARRLG